MQCSVRSTHLWILSLACSLVLEDRPPFQRQSLYYCLILPHVRILEYHSPTASLTLNLITYTVVAIHFYVLSQHGSVTVNNKLPTPWRHYSPSSKSQLALFLSSKRRPSLLKSFLSFVRETGEGFKSNTRPCALLC